MRQRERERDHENGEREREIVIRETDWFLTPSLAARFGSANLGFRVAKLCDVPLTEPPLKCLAFRSPADDKIAQKPRSSSCFCCSPVDCVRRVDFKMLQFRNGKLGSARSSLSVESIESFTSHSIKYFARNCILKVKWSVSCRKLCTYSVFKILQLFTQFCFWRNLTSKVCLLV